MRLSYFLPIANIAIGGLVVSPYMSPAGRFSERLTLTGAALIAIGIAALATRIARQRLTLFAVLNMIVGLWLIVFIRRQEGELVILWSNVLFGVVTFVIGLLFLAYEPSRSHRGTSTRDAPVA